MNLPEGNRGLGRRQGLPPRYSNIVGKQVRLTTASGKNVLAFRMKLFPKTSMADTLQTYTGSIAISVNPITKLPHLYNIHMMELYKEALFGELSPHVLVVAYASYRAMMNKCQGQSILVSGESGGKTETTKLVMQCLAFVGGRVAGDDRTVECYFGKLVEIQFDSNRRISGAAIRT